jgi:hypothetical protein
MSRGPGVWQRRILAVLAERPAFYLRHLLPEHPSRAQHVALLRAAHALEAQGHLTLTCWVPGGRPRGHVMVTRPGEDAMSWRREHNVELTGWGRWKAILSVAEVTQ